MTRTRLRWIVAVGVTTFLTMLSFSPFPALAIQADPARKPILEMIPKDAAGFVVLRDLAHADKAVATLAAKMKLPIPGPTAILKGAVGRDLPIDTQGSIAAIYFEPKHVHETKSGANISLLPMPDVLLLPVQDFKKFRDAFQDLTRGDDGLYKVTLLDTPTLLASKDGYVLLASEESRKWLDRVLQVRPKHGIAAEVRPWKAWIDRQVAYGFVTKNARKAYREKLFKNMRELSLKQLEPVDRFGFGGFKILRMREMEPASSDDISRGDSTRKDAKKSPTKEELAIAQYEVVDYIMQIYDSVDLLAAGVKIDKDGTICMTFRCGMAADSTFSRLLATRQPVPDHLLTSLPDEDFILAGGRSLLDGSDKAFWACGKNMRLLLPQLEPVSPSLKDSENFFLYEWPDDHFRYDQQGRSFLLGVPRKNQATFENVCAITWVTDINRGFQNIQKDAETLKYWCECFNKETEDLSFKMLTEKTYTEGQKTFVVTVDMSKYLGNRAKDAGTIAQGLGPLLEKVYAPQWQLCEYNIQLDDRRILSSYCSDPKFRKELLRKTKTSKGGFTDRADVKPILAMLPEEAQCKYFWSPCGTAKYLEWLMKITVPIHDRPLPLDKLPKLEDSPAIGLALSTTEKLLEFTIIVSPETLGNSIKYGMRMQAFFESIEQNQD